MYFKMYVIHYFNEVKCVKILYISLIYNTYVYKLCIFYSKSILKYSTNVKLCLCLM